MVDIFEAKGRFATKINPPMLACNNCGKVTFPKSQQTRILCSCGKVYTLMAEGTLVRKLPLR